MTREADNVAHYSFLPNGKKCYPNNSPVKTTSYRVSRHLSANSYASASTYRAAAQPELENISVPLWTAGTSRTFDFASLPQPDQRAPAMHAPEARWPFFAAPLGGVAAHCRETVCRVYGVRSCWREYARSPISLNRGLQNVALQRETSCVNYFRSSCFYGSFGQKIEPRTTCASLARKSERRSTGSRASTRRTMPKSPRSCAANTASNFYSTSWAMRGHPGSRPSAKPRTLARYGVNSQNSNAGSHRWKWASNKEAA